MAIECAVITAILVVIVVAFARKKRKTWALATVPLTLVPFVDFVLGLVVYVFQINVSVFAGVLMLLLAVGASCAWIGFAANGLKNKNTRLSYIFIANGFNLCLAAILIHNILKAANEVNAVIKPM